VNRWTALLLAASFLAGVRPARAGEAMAILAERTPWRCHFTWKSVQVRRASGKLEFVEVQGPYRRKPKLAALPEPVRSPLPPAGWAGADFDDADWARSRAPLFTRGTRELALLCARGKFRVTDPARAGEVRLALTFRGGAAVYLNGRQIGRAHLPAGAIDLDTPGDDYPAEAYVAPDGYQPRWLGFGEPEKYADRFALRDRRLEAAVPAAALRKGVNVLAVELHRAPVAEAYFLSKFRDARRYSEWDMIGLERVSLTASGPGVEANVSRPAGLRVWNHPVFASVHNVDFGDPSEAVRPIEIAAARNGAFSGQVVVGADEHIGNLKASVTALAGADGSAIPASAVQVRYGLPADHAESHNESHRLRAPVPYGRLRRRFDGLAEHAPRRVPAGAKAGGAVVPVWVTVRVPPEARPGSYAGTLTIRADGAKAVRVPVKLDVAGWALPEAKAFASFMGLVQSPESLALHYKVAMWSPEHWRLIDRSFELMGQLGVKTVYLPLLGRTYFGNEHSMVRWIRQDHGSWKHDFRIVEKYLDTAVAHLGKVPVVCAYCWEVSTGSKYMGLDKYKFADNAGMPFTVLDPATGKLVGASGPKWGDERIRAFWKPVLAGLRGILAKRGMAKSLMVGISGDRRPNRDAVEDLAAAAPEAPWVSSSHNVPRDLFGQPVGYATFVWGVGMAPDPSDKRWYGWRNADLLAAFPRYGSSAIGHGMRTTFAVGCYRIGMESALTSPGGRRSLRGIGRCGADFWAVLPGARGRADAVLGRFPESKAWHGGWLANSTPYLLAPGRDGPVATVRFEALREGIQETEARIFLERALTDPARRARLGEGLARRCQEILDRRVRVNRRALAGGGRHLTWTWLAGSGVRGRTAALYAAAAEAASRLAE